MGSKIIITIIILLLFTDILIFTRNKRKVSLAATGQIDLPVTELNWNKALKHDLITYLVPPLVLALPLFLDNITPNLTDVFQAILLFLVLVYLKHLYWGKI